MRLPSALDNLRSREDQEVQRAVDLLWWLTRKYRNATTPLMTACTAAAKIVVRRQIEAAGYDLEESPGGYSWRKTPIEEAPTMEPQR